MDDLAQARELVRQGSYENLKARYASVPDVLSELIRTALIPYEGGKYIVADFSAIEARVIAYLAGEQWRLDVFQQGGDIYCASASQMFHVPVVKHGENGHLRQKGKIAELALGYGGSVGALKAMGALDMGLMEEELKPLVDAWRTANPKIVKLWWDVDSAVMEAVRDGRRRWPWLCVRAPARSFRPRCRKSAFSRGFLPCPAAFPARGSAGFCRPRHIHHSAPPE